MRNKSDLEEVIKSHAQEPYKELLVNEIKHSIRLKTIEASNENKIGQSKLGGSPDLPTSVEWPKIDDKEHYGFLGQVNLDQIKEYDLDNELPGEGVLYFFHDMDVWENGKVIYSNDVNQLVRVSPPDDIKHEKKTLIQRILNSKGRSKLLKERRLEIFNEYHFFPKRSVELARLLKQYDISNVKSYEMINEEIYADELLYDEDEGSWTPNHHLLGYHNNIQHYYYQFSLANLPHRISFLNFKEIEKALEWKLLFQFDSDSNLDTDWREQGRIYFFIHKDDLLKRNFDNVKVIGDNHAT